MKNKQSKKPTMKMVAAEAGVSIQTVSRVLNDRPDVAPETRKRVEEVIDRLGYTPNIYARSLSQQRSKTIGYVTDPFGWMGPVRLLAGVT
ncbi:MAG: LacI family DNA-binding transcriptional regulator, partial [Anaerolineaceae bacterium]|nr:LacI family DNA-binding transcriptional regulator [Anaerolineaceae bacterium]